VVGVLAFAATWATMGAAVGAANPSEDDLVRQGVEARKRQDDAAALELFSKAYEVKHSPRAAAQMGLAEVALGRWVDAEAHLEEALAAATDPWVKKNSKTLSDSLGQVKKEIGSLDILGPPAGTEIVIGGAVKGTLPLAKPLRVRAGDVRFELRAPGYDSETRTVHAVAGQLTRETVELTPARRQAPVQPVAAAATGTVPVVTEASGGAGEATGRGRQIVKWSAFGAAGLGLVTGVVATLIHQSKVSAFNNDANMGCADNNGQAVHMSDGSAAPECQGDLDAYRSARTWQIVGFVAAGAFAATGLVLMLTEPRPSGATGEHRAVAAWTCAPSLVSAGIACQARF
jgi:hypothetical protein